MRSWLPCRYPQRANELFPPLPEELNTPIVALARVNTPTQFRRRDSSLAGKPLSFMMGLEQFGHRLSGQELVHTSYFDNPDVLDLLTMHIAWAQGVPTGTRLHKRGRWRLPESWLRQAKIELGAGNAAMPAALSSFFRRSQSG